MSDTRDAGGRRPPEDPRGDEDRPLAPGQALSGAPAPKRIPVVDDEEDEAQIKDLLRPPF